MPCGDCWDFDDEFWIEVDVDLGGFGGLTCTVSVMTSGRCGDCRGFVKEAGTGWVRVGVGVGDALLSLGGGGRGGGGGTVIDLCTASDAERATGDAGLRAGFGDGVGGELIVL